MGLCRPGRVTEKLKSGPNISTADVCRQARRWLGHIMGWPGRGAGCPVMQVVGTLPHAWATVVGGTWSMEVMSELKHL